MNHARFTGVVFCQALLAVLLANSPLLAQDAAQADDLGLDGQLYTSPFPISIPEGQKIIPVRVLRQFELGSALLEQFAATPNCLLERRERPLTDLVWKVSPGINVTPIVVVVRNALQPANHRLGARFDYSAKADPTAGIKEEHASHILDLDELKALEIVLNAMTKALDQPPAQDEIATLQYKSRSGFTVSLTQRGSDQTITATAGKVTGNSKEQARSMFEQTTTMVRNLINQLAAY